MHCSQPCTLSSGAGWLVTLCAAGFAAVAGPDDSASAQTYKGQTKAKAEDVGDERTLNGHYFLPSGVLEWPFATTHFQFEVGLGYGTGNFPSGDQLLGLDVAAFFNSLEYQYAITDFLAVRVGGVATMLGGTNEDAALFFGATFGFEAGGGLTLTYRFADIVQISLLGDIRHGPDYNLNILNAINESLAQNAVDLGNGFTQANDTFLSTDLVVAIGTHPILGVYLTGGWIANAEPNREPSAGRLGLGLSFDLEEAFLLQLGALAAYQVLIPEQGENSHVASFGLYYSGRAALALGIEGSIFIEPIGNGEDFTTLQSLFVIQYFW